MEHLRVHMGGLSQAGGSPTGTPLHHSHHHAAQSLSQPGLPPVNPLPLPPRVRLPPLRQRKLQDYLKSLNSMTRSIVLETETLAHEHHRDWDDMNDARREEVVNNHFIPTGVRVQYERARYVNIDALRVPCGPCYNGNGTGPATLSQPLERVAAAGTNSDVTSRSHTPALTTEDYSLSQAMDENSLSQSSYYSYNPSLSLCESPAAAPLAPAGFTPCYRLHKKQLSFRPNAVQPHVERTPAQQPHPKSNPRERLGSDGESIRTSDEDSSPLSFQRNRFRSYSMRPKKSSGRGARSSNRSLHRPRRPTTPDANANRRTTVQDSSSEVSTKRTDCEGSSTPAYEGDDIDADIDLPLDFLLLDPVPDEPVDRSTPVTSSLRYSRNRKSQKSRPKIVVQDDCGDDADAESETGVVVHNKHASVDSTHSDSSPLSVDISSNSLLGSFSTEVPIPQPAEGERESLSRSHSLDLLGEQGRSSPDSIVSSSSILSFRGSRSRKEEVNVLRNPRGKRGGSSYRTATSKFADRHEQFKPNMLQHKLRSGPSTREGTPVLPDEDCLSQEFLRPPTMLSLAIQKCSSLAESELSYQPSSPDQHSIASSIPSTPVIQSLPKMLVLDSQRESGYISSSSDSFAFRRI